MSLIEQEDVLKAINNMIRETESVYVTSALRNFEAVVKGMRTIEPRKKGKWIDSHTTCSECGWQMIDDVIESPNIVAFNFCPNCGAEMTEGEG